MCKCRWGGSYREEKDKGTAKRGQWTIKVPVTMGRNGTRVWVQRLTSCSRSPLYYNKRMEFGGQLSQSDLVWNTESFLLLWGKTGGGKEK